MCHLRGWLKLFLKNVRWEKIKIQKRWLLGRLSDGSYVPSLYVYFCRSYLMCRLLGLQVTVRGFAMVGQSKYKSSILYKSSTEELPLNFAVSPHYCKTLVICSTFIHPNYPNRLQLPILTQIIFHLSFPIQNRQKTIHLD